VIITFIAEMNLMKIWIPNVYLSFFTVHTKQVISELTSVSECRQYLDVGTKTSIPRILFSSFLFH